MRMRACLTFLFSLAMACGSPDAGFVGELTAPVVYGSDDRLEVFEEPDADLRRIADESIVALIPTSSDCKPGQSCCASANWLPDKL